jgi:hypothetical protein
MDLKQNIKEEVAAISPSTLQRVMQNFRNAWGNVLTTRDATSQTLYSGN